MMVMEEVWRYLMMMESDGITKIKYCNQFVVRDDGGTLL